ncbi:MAG: hypothetical protein JNK67_06870 [Alphaproteobacteria bacterium]|nr:hypothetical protein [Alphaproteobacteria bacterium]
MTALAFKRLAIAAAVTFGAAGFGAGSALAGPVFLTGHDPDFHAQDSVHAQHLLSNGLSFVTGGTFDDAAPAKKFLWVESNLAPPGGFRVGKLGLTTGLGLVEGVHFDQVNGADFATVDLSLYSAVAVASSFGGMLTSAEIAALNARAGDIKTFVNAGGGLLALAECFPASSFCLANNVTAADALFGFVPVAVSSAVTVAPYSLTAAGAAMFPALTDDDMNDPTHNSFGATGGLTVVDVDSAGTPTTLAGIVRITDGGFEGIPAPATLAVFGAALVGLAGLRRRG